MTRRIGNLRGFRVEFYLSLTAPEQTKGLNIEGTIEELKTLGITRWGFFKLKYQTSSNGD